MPIHLQGKIKMDSKNGLRPASFCTVFFSQVTKGNTTFCDVHLLFVCVFLYAKFYCVLAENPSCSFSKYDSN